MTKIDYDRVRRDRLLTKPRTPLQPVVGTSRRHVLSSWEEEAAERRQQARAQRPKRKRRRRAKRSRRAKAANPPRPMATQDDLARLKLKFDQRRAG